MDELITNLFTAMRLHINQLKWMSPETKTKALAKLETYKRKIGYNKAPRGYAGLKIDNSYAGNNIRVNQFQVMRNVNDLGKPTPDYTGSFGGTLTFAKNWQVGSLFEFKGGNYSYWCLICGFRNASPRGTNSKAFQAVNAKLLDPASTPQQRLEAAKTWVYSLASLTPYQGLNEVSSGDFLRFRELNVTYTAPRGLASRMGARNMSFTVTGRNLWLKTKYQGVDPEVAYVGQGGQSGVDENFVESIDGFGLPLARRIGFSIRLGY
jgi:hypothetical protein